MSKPIYEIEIISKGILFVRNNKYQFMIKLKGEIIALSVFKYTNPEVALEAAKEWTDANTRF